MSTNRDGRIPGHVGPDRDLGHPGSVARHGVLVYSAISDVSIRKFTTTFVLLECANAASRRSFRRNVDDLRDELARSGTLIFPTDEDWQSAWDEYRQGPPGPAGVVDLISFRVMKALGLTDAFTNDSHYRSAGLTPLF